MLARALSVALLFAVSALPAAAGDVAVTGVHVCCASCVKGVEHALKDVAGVRNVRVVRKTRTIRFNATDDKAAAAGIQALATAGFHGRAQHGAATLDFPASGAKQDSRAAQIRLAHVHLCCGACVRAVDEAVSRVAGVSSVAADRDQASVVVSGREISVVAVVEALNHAGFHATVEP